MNTPYFEKLLYLDRDFISSKYEYEKGVSPNTTISKNESIKAGVKYFLFSGGISASESKNYQVSTVGMLSDLESSLKNYPKFESLYFENGVSSQICWVEGFITVDHIEITKSTTTITLIGKPERNSNDNKKNDPVRESFFSVYMNEKPKFVLVPTEEYWVSGISSFQNLIDTVIESIDIPIKGLFRVYSAQTTFEQWVAVPLLILEQ